MSLYWGNVQDMSRTFPTKEGCSNENGALNSEDADSCFNGGGFDGEEGFDEKGTLDSGDAAGSYGGVVAGGLNG